MRAAAVTDLIWIKSRPGQDAAAAISKGVGEYQSIAARTKRRDCGASNRNPTALILSWCFVGPNEAGGLRRMG
jgi:hypothetical protein